ncbi:small conductance mechanosensitive channel [Methylophilus rhizosphaerae]|uniref:Small-conductance mechanosensitive channel n=1 Tax=Methylophilus rhizosphaerae TaxID=492660 RepID=A0A1G9E6A2_9PROT|nr:mechanosensitive ion channel family protein [Methylophilus rhizosphaerae]SDK71587.1 small conductance mechanosensitive channel [Methylophilus rhizosphaerae]
MDIQSADQIKSAIIEIAFQFGPKLIVAVLIIIAGFYVARWAGRILGANIKGFHLEPPVEQLLVRILRILVQGLFVIMALQNLGVQLLPLLAGLGVAGAGIALAMQGVLGNVVAGLTIIFTKPFKVGEYISIVSEEGVVENISLFTSVLSHADRSHVVIPNRKIVGEILHNYGKIRQLDLEVRVSYDTDLDKALNVIQAILNSNQRVLKEPEAVIKVGVLASSSINILVKPWVNVPDYNLAGGEINKAIIESFRQSDIVIPFPQHEVRLLNSESAK